MLHRASDFFFIEEDTAAITVKCRRDPLYPTLENVIPGRTVSHLANKIIPSIIWLEEHKIPKNKICKFHKKKGHSTGECRTRLCMLAKQAEDQKNGKPKEKESSPPPKENPKASSSEREQPKKKSPPDHKRVLDQESSSSSSVLAYVADQWNQSPHLLQRLEIPKYNQEVHPYLI